MGCIKEQDSPRKRGFLRQRGIGGGCVAHGDGIGGTVGGSSANPPYRPGGIRAAACRWNRRDGGGIVGESDAPAHRDSRCCLSVESAGWQRGPLAHPPHPLIGVHAAVCRRKRWGGSGARQRIRRIRPVRFGPLSVGGITAKSTGPSGESAAPTHQGSRRCLSVESAEQRVIVGASAAPARRGGQALRSISQRNQRTAAGLSVHPPHPPTGAGWGLCCCLPG